jgi:hypothetical protein
MDGSPERAEGLPRCAEAPSGPLALASITRSHWNPQLQQKGGAQAENAHTPATVTFVSSWQFAPQTPGRTCVAQP